MWNLYGYNKNWQHPEHNTNSDSQQKDLLLKFKSLDEAKDYVAKSRLKVLVPEFIPFKANTVLRYYRDYLITDKVLNEGEKEKGEWLLQVYRDERAETARRNGQMRRERNERKKAQQEKKERYVSKKRRQKLKERNQSH